LLLNNVNAKVVSERLGHASIEITLNTYSHVLPTMQQQAATVMGGILGRVLAPSPAAGVE
jgi:integrase